MRTEPYRPAASALDGASWITVADEQPSPPGERPAYEFRTAFTVPGVSSRAATLAITAHGIYEAFVNDVRVGEDELTPGLTSYRSTLQVQQYQVAGLLRTGRNELRIVVSDGWFRGRCGASRIADNFGTEIACIARLEVTGSDGTRSLVTTDANWSVAAGSIVAADLMDGQRVDLRRLGELEWAPVRVSANPLTRQVSRLVESAAPPVRRVATYPAVRVSRLPSGRQIVDFGTTVNGWVRLADLGPAGTRTTLTHGEWLLPDGDLDMTHAAYTRWPQGGLMTLGQRDEVISRGVGSDVFEPRHTTHGFRYVAIDGRADDIEPTTIEAVLVRSDLRRTAEFRIDEPRLARLHDVAVQSWLVNSCDVPTDCPQRERWGYTGDYQVFIHTATFLEDVDLFSRKWLRSLADDQEPSGRVTNVAPYCGDDPIIPEPLHGAAGWGDAATVVPWELYRAYGDPEILRSSIDMMIRWIDWVTARARGHRHRTRVTRSARPAPHEQFIWDTGWQWGEWQEPGHHFDAQEDQGIVATAYFKRSAEIVAASLRALGDDDRAAAYARLADDVAQAWRLEFVDPGTGRLRVDRQAHYVRALAFGLVGEDDRDRMATRLVELVEDAQDHLTTGFLSTGLLLPTLADAGHVDVAYRLLFQDTSPSWLTMLDRGATAVWESWDGVDAAGRAHHSLAHYAKGAVVSFLHEYTAGLRQHPDSAGWDRFVVAPTPGPDIDATGLTFASRRGRIDVEWVRTGDALDLRVTVPAGASAEVLVAPEKHLPIGPGTHELRVRL